MSFLDIGDEDDEAATPGAQSGNVAAPALPVAIAELADGAHTAR